MENRRIALVTGASRGIGAATALEFARRGYDLAITADDAEGLHRVSEELKGLKARVFEVAGDLADISFVNSIASRAIAALGRIDVLVNNAAWRELATMRQITLESWDKTLRVSLTAPAFLARSVAQHMEAAKTRGVIINVSSIMSSHASGIAPAYIAAKGGLDALTYDLAALYGSAGIRVVSVNPGAVDCGMSHDRDTDAKDDFDRRERDWSEQMIPLRRWATPAEIGRAIVMLASDDASYITGTTVLIDGGWSHHFQPHNLKREQHPDQFS
jgi:NAD(P)-dependent dehydrogenase (short-subunit alcohol dehydrogenase family)